MADIERPGAEHRVPADPTIDDLRTAVDDVGEAGSVLLTVHPSAVLRLQGTPEWDAAFEELTADLRVAASALE